jgi:hypothetical protein
MRRRGGRRGMVVGIDGMLIRLLFSMAAIERVEKNEI